jgi:hypothetical protein
VGKLQKPSQIRSSLSVFSEQVSYSLREQSTSSLSRLLQIVDGGSYSPDKESLPVDLPLTTFLVAAYRQRTRQSPKLRHFKFGLRRLLESSFLPTKPISWESSLVRVKSGYLQRFVTEQFANC